MIRQVFFEVTTPLPTLNKLLRMHWGTKKRLQDNLDNELEFISKTQLNGGEIPPMFLYHQYSREQPKKQKRVLIISLWRKKLQDPDNLVGSVKPLVDAIKKAGLIYDDSPEWITLKVKQTQGKPEKIFVEVRGKE
jgi:hypothetical protein